MTRVSSALAACVDQIIDKARKAYKNSRSAIDMESEKRGTTMNFTGEKTVSFRKRAALEDVEQQCLERLHTEGVWLLRSEKLKSWPRFFHTIDECGEEMQKGLMLLWSSYLVVGTLLAAVAIQPLIMVQGLGNEEGRAVYGMLWTLALLSDFMGLSITAIFLGYLLSVPGKLTWLWLCKIGVLRRLPTLVLVLDTIISLFAVGYTVWTLYGPTIGATCIIAEVSCSSVVIWVYWFLSILCLLLGAWKRISMPASLSSLCDAEVSITGSTYRFRKNVTSVYTI